MPTTPHGFTDRINELKATIATQGHRVQALLEQAFESAFAVDASAAAAAIALDDEIDRVDVDIERRAVQLLTDATHEGAALPSDQLRLVLTIVKVNNELERIADAGAAVAELVPHLLAAQTHLPPTTRIITNSCVGILRDACGALARNDPHLAKVVLASEDAVAEFKRTILRDAQTRLCAGSLTFETAFILQELTSLCERLAEHCTNIAEQALYAATGTIVRHTGGHWHEVPRN